MRKEADFGITEVSITETRGQVIDYSISYIQLPVTFATSVGHKQIPVTLLIEPFDPNVWLALGLAAIFLALMLQLCAAMKFYNPKHFGTLMFGLFRWICDESVPDEELPASASMRFFCVVSLLAIFILVVCYQNCMFTILTESEQIKPIDSIRDLAHAVDNLG